MAATSRLSVGAAAVGERGTAILTSLGIRMEGDPRALAAAIVPPEAEPFRPDLEAGLACLLAAVARRSPELAAAAAARLVGLGPGRTPLGDDYLAGTGIAVARFGGAAGFASPNRERWLAALMPRQLLGATNPTSAQMITRAVHGVAEPEVTCLLRLRGLESGLTRALARLCTIGATSGRGWAASIGATATLLAAGLEDHEQGAPAG
jgi:hypothetical protein